MANSDALLVVEVRGRIGHLQLNRPHALNALSLELIQKVIECLRDWSTDDAIDAVLMTGYGDRAFCAGVDVKSIYESGKSSQPGAHGELAGDLFRFEYTMDHLVATYPKPCISYWDGIVMGGGVGISVMGSHRVASDRTKLAMPETGIGLFPDVGASYFLSRLGPIGLLLGTTGVTIGASDLIELGLATHHVPHASRARWIASLCNDGIEDSLDQFSTATNVSADWKRLSEIAERCFQGQQIEEVFASLESLVSSREPLSIYARGILNRLEERSPTSLVLTMEQMRRGAEQSYEDCLVMEYRMSQVCLQRNDFYEGVRAVLVDRDQSPNWDPASVSDVVPGRVASHFEHLGELDLQLS
ncbi:MAG: enoyl-CoA hydratase/isomerase family protein [Planctomycetota bacterium]